MSDAIIISLINTAGLVVIGIGVALINKKTTQIHKDVNGKMAELIDVTKIAAKAEGNLEGRAKQRADGAETAAATVQAIKDDKDIDITKSK